MQNAVFALALACVCTAAPALAFNPPKAPPTRAYYAGGSGAGMKVELIIQLPFTDGALHNPAFVSMVTALDCHGRDRYVTWPGGKVGYPRGTFSASGHGAVVDRQGTWLHREVEGIVASGTIDGGRATITYTLPGCPTRRYTLTAGA